VIQNDEKNCYNQCGKNNECKKACEKACYKAVRDLEKSVNKEREESSLLSVVFSRIEKELSDCKAACDTHCSERLANQERDDCIKRCKDVCLDKHEEQRNETSQLANLTHHKDFAHHHYFANPFQILVIPESFHEWMNAGNAYETAQKNLLQKEKLLALKAKLEEKAAYLRNHVAAKFAGDTIEDQIVSGLETEREAIPFLAEKLGLTFSKDQIQEISEYVRWRKFYDRNQSAAVAKLRETQMEIAADEAQVQREARMYFQDQKDKAESVSNQIKILGISQEILNQQMISQIPIVVQKEAANG